VDRDARTRARVEQHWATSESGDIDTVHAIYTEDAILDYPQSGERFRGRSRSRRSAGGTRLNATSLSCGSGAAATCG
jgi:ketosteroid isomerase-like protein